MRISGAERALAAIGYLPLLCFLPVKLRKDSIFVQFHARQGSVLFGLWFLLGVLCFIGLFIGAETFFLATFFLATIVYGLLIALVVLFKVLPGERYRMPVVADVALLLRL